MSKFTAKEAKELGIPLPLLNKWQYVMDTLWSFFVAYSKTEKKVQLNNKSNSILYRLADGHHFNISVFFMNTKYLELIIRIDDNDDFEVRISNIDQFKKEGIIRTVAEILTHAEKIK